MTSKKRQDSLQGKYKDLLRELMSAFSQRHFVTSPSLQPQQRHQYQDKDKEETPHINYQLSLEDPIFWFWLCAHSISAVWSRRALHLTVQQPARPIAALVTVHSMLHDH